MAQYREVHFRIQSQYQGYDGWPSEEAANQFREETRKLFESIGWTIKPGDSATSDTAIKGQQDLYLHPTSFSGVILEKNVPVLEALFNQATTFKCYAIDQYEEYQDLSDEAYMDQLKSRRDEIIASILDALRTKRSNLYVTGDIVPELAKPFVVKRVCDKRGFNNIAQQYVRQMMDELTADGQLVTADTKHGVGIRTATRTELDVRPRGIRWPDEMTLGQ